MKKALLFQITLLLLTWNSFSQTQFAVHHFGEAAFFKNFTAALDASLDGDTIYLPGGNFNIGSAVIDKKLVLVGAGHYPQYSVATGITSLQGDIILVTGADHSQLHGFYLTGNIRLGNSTANQQVSNISISRCSINELRLNYDGSDNPTTSQNIMVMENVIRGQLYGAYAQYVFFSKNFFGARVIHFNGNATFTNNIFLKQANSSYDYVIGYTESTLFYNNIFLTHSYLLRSTFANTFNHNIFVQNLVMPAGSTGIGNTVKKPLAEIFVNHSENVFNYESDFHLAETSGGIGAGTDGNDIGIYGTNIPYKEGAVPFNPRIVSGQVSAETDVDGNIQIDIIVNSQQR